MPPVTGRSFAWTEPMTGSSRPPPRAGTRSRRPPGPGSDSGPGSGPGPRPGRAPGARSKPAAASAVPATAPEATDAPAGSERIAKALARAGVASRRDAERLIADGRVAVNGVQLVTPAFTVSPRDRITLDGQPVQRPEALRLWRYHKPAGLVTTHRDPAGRPTVFEHLPEDLPRVISVGRLDLTTEGLLLLTNDGELARSLELPSSGWLRRYRVRAFGRPDVEALAGLRQGITVDGIAYGPIEALLERAEGANAWLTVSLREGKNREVRTVLEAVGLKVNRLIRVSYGPFQLGHLPAGAVEEVPPSAFPEMLGRLMPGEPVRGTRPPEPVVAAALPARAGKPGAAGKTGATGKTGAAGKPGTRPDRAVRTDKPAAAGKPERPQQRKGKRRLDPFEEEAAIAATLAARRKGAGTGKGTGHGPGQGPGKGFGKGPGKGPGKGRAQPRSGFAGSGGPSGNSRSHSSTRPTSKRP